MGRALTAAMPDWAGPFGHGFDGTDADGPYDVVLLAVPDAAIAAAAAAIRPGPLVGHTAGAIGLDVLAPHEAFGVHPLMTVPATGADFTGAGGAVAGATARALTTARWIAHELGLDAFEIADVDRGAYHAAASIASNFLVALEDAAETILATAGAERRILVPLVRAAVDNWAVHGGPAALTGPIARGDVATVARQRTAIDERAPELLTMFDAMCDLTRALAHRQAAASSADAPMPIEES
jgi:predicted short-subunit dehydrogenase-like oxidoreductase (DUF2520 family)